MGGLAEGGGKGWEASSSEFQGLVGGVGFDDGFRARWTDGARLCCEEVELREYPGGPTVIVLSWSSVKRPNSSTARRLSSSSLPEVIWFDGLEAFVGRRCLPSKDWGGGGRRGAWVRGEGGLSGLVVYIYC